jgi:hypothetical protein
MNTVIEKIKKMITHPQALGMLALEQSLRFIGVLVNNREKA